MAFRFPLESVLQLRRSIEQQQELKLHSAAQQVVRMRQRIENTEKHMEALRTQIARSLEAGTSSAELRVLNDAAALWRQNVTHLNKELLHLESLHNQQLERYREDRHRREVLENLRTQSFEAYRRKVARQEQRRVDDLFLMRHARNQQG